MENIEQIKQERDKLQERLNNAAKFFREQKAQIETLTSEVKEKTSLAMDYRNQIETLTKENEELKRNPKEEVIDVEKWNALVTEKENFETVSANKQKVIEKLESDIDSKDKAYKVLQDTYNEVFAENEKLKSEAINTNNTNNTKVPELETKLNNANAAYEELRKKYAELKELHDGDLKRYNELEDNYEGLQNKYKEQEEQLNTAKNAIEKTVKKFEQLREANNLLQDKSVEIANDVKKYQTKYNDEHLLVEEYKKQIQELKDTSNNQLKELSKELEEVKANREEFRSQLVDLEKKYDQLDKLYDTCEAEKMTACAECNKLQEKIKYIEANNISDKEWQDHLENVIEQIRNLADDVINPKPASNENKENVMKRTGDYNVSGENIGI